VEDDWEYHGNSGRAGLPRQFTAARNLLVMAPILRNVSTISWCDIWSNLAVESSTIRERSAITSNCKRNY
jgi:hypothetical protein